MTFDFNLIKLIKGVLDVEESSVTVAGATFYKENDNYTMVTGKITVEEEDWEEFNSKIAKYFLVEKYI